MKYYSAIKQNKIGSFHYLIFTYFQSDSRNLAIMLENPKQLSLQNLLPPFFPSLFEPLTLYLSYLLSLRVGFHCFLHHVNCHFNSTHIFLELYLWELFKV